MRNIKLNLSYDGSRYHGFQIQKNAVTIQETVEKAIHEITGQSVRIIGCSRTDAGVHALDYVCNFHSDTLIPDEKLPFALNAHLPDDIACTCAQTAAEDFHARYSAKSKIYIYKIHNSPHRNPLYGRYSWHYPISLDIPSMQKAAEYIVGTHDFSAFMASGGQQKTTVKTVYSLSVSNCANEITVKIHADGYLYNMVRIITGTLVYAGNGKIDPNDIASIIESLDRRRAGITAPPQGLALAQVFY